MARHGQKQFTTWDYRDKQVTLKIPVLLIDTTKAAGGLHGDHTTIPGYDSNKPPKTYFKVQMEEPEVHECDTDINRLQETVYKRVRETVAIEWKPMLYVTVSAGRKRLYRKKLKPDTLDTETDAAGSLRLGWERWQIATFKGKKISRRFNNYYKPFGHGSEKEAPREVWAQSGEDWPEVGAIDSSRRWRKDDDEDMPEMGALIPDTPENRAALEAIGDKLEELYRSLSVLLGSDQIEHTLAQVAANGLAALPAPPAQVTAKKRRRR